MFLFLMGKYLEMELLTQEVGLGICLFLLENATCFFLIDCTICISTHKKKVSEFHLALQCHRPLILPLFLILAILMDV